MTWLVLFIWRPHIIGKNWPCNFSVFYNISTVYILRYEKYPSLTDTGFLKPMPIIRSKNNIMAIVFILRGYIHKQRLFCWDPSYVVIYVTQSVSEFSSDNLNSFIWKSLFILNWLGWLYRGVYFLKSPRLDNASKNICYLYMWHFKQKPFFRHKPSAETHHTSTHTKGNTRNTLQI